MDYTDCTVSIRGREITDVIYSTLREAFDSVSILVRNKVYAESDIRIRATANGRRIKELVFAEARDILAGEMQRYIENRKVYRSPKARKNLSKQSAPCRIVDPTGRLSLRRR
jgi:hypothetical protein